MRDAVREQYDAFPDPSPSLVPIGPRQLDRMDDGLHFGWSWHRYRYAYRRSDGLRILDAGCGTGLTTLTLARLNPGSTVIGLDASIPSLDLARQRLAVAEDLDVSFIQHDLETPLPGGLGPFDFIVCRRVLGQVDDPGVVLKHLARGLDHRGLILATFPARGGRRPIQQFREAVEALSPQGATLADRARIGQDLFAALRPDHPIRQYKAQTSAQSVPTIDRLVSGYLNEAERDVDLAEAVAAVEQAGLAFLYAAAGHPWQPDRIFQGAIPKELQARVAGLEDRERTLLMDALDPTLHRDEHRIYASLSEFEPRLPSWPEERATQPESFDRLIPHQTGLAAAAGIDPDPATSRGRVSYRVVTGLLGEIDRRSHLLMTAVDGRRTCGQIDQLLYDQTGTTESEDIRQARWLDLANHGFVVLESPDPRQHVDCVHLGPIRDRLDCPCPRRWVRACERHGFCTIDPVPVDDPRAPALASALERLEVARVAVCGQCPDYTPEE